MTDRALEAALPGEAEVVFIGGETQALIERLKASAAHCEMINAPYAASACREAAASLQAMQARAEKAERERDEAYNKGYSARDEVVSACRSRAEAAEARVKELQPILDWAAKQRRKPYAVTMLLDALSRTGGSNG